MGRGLRGRRRRRGFVRGCFGVCGRLVHGSGRAVRLQHPLGIAIDDGTLYVADTYNNRILGYNGVYTGTGHVTRIGDPATFMMTQSARETYPGDKLFPGGVDVPLDFVPSTPKSPVKGSIMAVSDGVTVIGQYEVVVINRGVRDGLVPGNVLAVYSVQPDVYDNSKKGYVHPTATLFAKKVSLPEERTGTFLVFKTFERMSFGLIMEATDIIRVDDHVETP